MTEKLLKQAQEIIDAYSDGHHPILEQIAEELIAYNYRVNLDDQDTLSNQMRVLASILAETQRYMLTAADRLEQAVSIARSQDSLIDDLKTRLGLGAEE